jgi:uridine phosphorylase
MVESWRLWDAIRPEHEMRRVSSWSLDADYYESLDAKLAVLVCQGAALAADGVERVIGAGGRRIIRLGTAGGLDTAQKVGDLVVSYAAIRDEGTSHCYLPASVPACADLDLAFELAESLRDQVGNTHGPCLTWTTDGRWVESNEQIDCYTRLSARAVDMETAGLFAAAQAKGIRAASVSVLADLPIMHRSEEFKGLPTTESEWNAVCDRARAALATIMAFASDQ